MNAAPSNHAAVPTETAEPGTRPLQHEARPISDSARQRMERLAGEPLFLADWLDVTMLHFAVDPERLRTLTPFALDCRDGRAFVTLVAFRMTNMRLRRFPEVSRRLFRPITDSLFLNLRTYVRQGSDAGIQFLVEWLSNRLSVRLGPIVYGLPYRAGRLEFATRGRNVALRAAPRGTDPLLDVELEAEASGAECERGSLDEFLLERYMAFTECGSRRRRFHIWHRPWPQTRCMIRRLDAAILAATFPTLAGARFVGANHSGGVRDVWMSRPFPL